MSRATDGPVGMDRFRWRGFDFPGLTKNQWRFLKTIYDSPEWVVNFEALAVPVWGEVNSSRCSGYAVGSYRRQVNRFFERHAIPLKIEVDGIGKRVGLSERPCSETSFQKKLKARGKPAQRPRPPL